MNYLTELIVRPQRNVYNLKDLGDSAFSFSGQDFKRLDFANGQIKNFKGHKISCSLWCPLDSTNKDLATSPLIIYSHGNAGNKIDIIEIFEFLLWEFNICSFDFSGAGFSEGDYVTLGYYEKYDIQAVVEFLRKEFGIKNIILYGRSMGAVSSLRYCEMDSNIKAAVLDSPFCNFPRLCEEILSNKLFIPGVMSRYLISSARKRLLEKVEGFDIENFIPANNAKKVKVPTLIIHGKSDELVDITHSREIYNNINKNTYKLLLEVEGFHNDTRPPQSVNTIRDFIMQYSYDALILKEHRRRLNIKNAHLSFKAKYSLDINSIVDNFRLTQENNNRNSFLNASNNFNVNVNDNNNYNNSSANNNHFLDHKLKQEISKANFDKIQLDEEEIQKLKLNISNYQSEYKRENNRRLNNFKINFNFMNANRKSRVFNKKMKNFIKSKSIDISTFRRNRSYFLTSCILFNCEKSINNNKIIIDSENFQGDFNRKIRKRTNSVCANKNDKFYATTLFKEENFLEFDDYEGTFFYDDNQNNNNNICINNFNNFCNNKNKTLDENFDLYEENVNLLNELSKEIKTKNKNEDYNKTSNTYNKNYFRNSTESKESSNRLNHKIHSGVELNFERSNSFKKGCNNNNNYQDVFTKNKNYFQIENNPNNININEHEKNYFNKTYCLDDKAKDHIDASFISTQETNNYTDIISDRGSINFGSGRGKLKTRRNQVLSGILNCDVKLGSSQITITDLDKTSLRKGRGSVCHSTIDESIKEDKIQD